MIVYKRQGSRLPKQKKWKKAKWLPEEALQIAEKKKRCKRERKKKMQKGKMIV